MKKRINLFQFGTQNAPPAIVVRVQKYSIGVGMVLFIIFLSINAIFLSFRLRLNSLKQQKSSLLSQLVENQDIEAQILYFSKKQNQLTVFGKEDANFLPYYTLLKDILVFSSNSPVLQSMSIDKDKKTAFVVEFEDFSKAYDFLHYVESDSFLKNFLALKLEKLTIAENAQSITKGYELHFSGTFKPINESDF